LSEARLIRAGHSPAFLAADGPLRRLPRQPERQRPREFLERFEDRALVYDCFRHPDGERILFVGPPPMNLVPELRRADYLALPAGTRLTPAFHASLSTMITELSGAPSGTTAVRLTVAGQSFELAVQPNHAAEFAGRRLLFTMSKDNELSWIAEWARWHQRLHGTDAIVLFDNGSSRYGTDEIEETLLGVDGIDRVAVLRWPYAYGMTDPALRVNPFYILFLQVSSMSVALRRFGAAAAGLLNCDIDELVSTPPGTTIYELCQRSRRGLVVMRGRFMEAEADPGLSAEQRTHRHYTTYLADPRHAASRPSKWILDPQRSWVRNLAVHPYMHWIEHRPWFSKTTPTGVFYRHFRGINTNWKQLRTQARHASPDELVQDAEFAELVIGDAF